MNILLSSSSSPTLALTQSLLSTSIKFYASKMQASSTQNNRDSAGRRLGLKKFGGEEVNPNDIIARQRGFKWKSGENVIVGKDQTIHAACEGVVQFRKSQFRKVPYYLIDVIPQENPNRKVKHPMPYVYHPELFPQRALNNIKPIVQVQGKNRIIADFSK